MERNRSRSFTKAALKSPTPPVFVFQGRWVAYTLPSSRWFARQQSVIFISEYLCMRVEQWNPSSINYSLLAPGPMIALETQPCPSTSHMWLGRQSSTALISWHCLVLVPSVNRSEFWQEYPNCHESELYLLYRNRYDPVAILSL